MLNSFRLGPLAKRLLLLSVSLLVAFLLVEVSIPEAFRVVRGREFPRARIQERLTALAEESSSEESTTAGTSPFSSEYVLHPYLGFTFNLGLRKYAPDSPLLGYRLPWMKRGPGHLVVMLAGGSFAVQIGALAGKELSTRLEQATGQKIQLVNVALGGYKQPQQLMALTYLLSLGAEFDLVINIDGFNEVALPPSEIVPQGVFPLYPRDWCSQTTKLDTFRLRQLKELDTLSSQRRRWAGIFHFASPTPL